MCFVSEPVPSTGWRDSFGTVVIPSRINIYIHIKKYRKKISVQTDNSAKDFSGTCDRSYATLCSKRYQKYFLFH